MSAKSKQKYYVVWEGHTPGIYKNWADCLLQVKAYPNAKYKAFDSSDEAKEAFINGFSASLKSQVSKIKTNSTLWEKFVPVGSIAVDAACEGNPGKMEYRGVDPYSKTEIFHIGPLQNGTNNIGEFLAIVHALAYLKKNNKQHTAIYSDSATAISWIKRKKANTKLEFNHSNTEIKDLLLRATTWLNSNSYSNPIIKWDTLQWGEIPADFGRK